MKKYSAEFSGEDWNICGIKDRSPLKIAWARTSVTPEREVLHYHLTGHEYYMVSKGCIRVQVENTTVDVRENEMLYVEPRERHAIVEVLEPAEYIVINTNPDPNDKVIFRDR